MCRANLEQARGNLVLIVADGRLALAKTNLNVTYAELLVRNGLSSLVGEGDYAPSRR